MKSLVDEVQGPGTHASTWDGTNAGGEEVASGLYLYKVTLGRFSQTKKMLYVR